MGADLVQADYEQLRRVAQSFGRQAEAYGALQKRLRRSVEHLHSTGWEGRGSAAFYSEMDVRIFPALQRLEQALREAQHITQQISTVMEAAEADAAQPFRNGPTAEGQRSGNSLPPAPSAPPLTPGDGSGPYGVAGPANEADWETYRKMETAVWLARLRGYDITADHMAHYLGNSGTPLAVDVDRMLREMPEFQRAMEQQFRQDVWGTAQQEIAARYTGEAMQFPITTGWRSDYYPGREQYPNWYYGVGGFSYSQTALVTVTPGDDPAHPIVTIQSQVHMSDRYNWDAGKSVNIPSTGVQWIDDHTIAGDHIPDTSMGRLHQTGIAQEYDLYGHADRVVTVYRYDPAQTQQAAPQPGATPDRNP